MVEVHRLTREAIVIEMEDTKRRHVNLVASRRHSRPLPIMCAGNTALDDDRVLGVVAPTGNEREVTEGVKDRLQEAGDASAPGASTARGCTR